MTRKKSAAKAKKKSPAKAAKKATRKKVAKKSSKKAAVNKAKPSAKKTVRRRAKAIAKPTDRSIDPDAMEFIHAIDAYKVAHDRPFPSWSEILHILRELGYGKKA